MLISHAEFEKLGTKRLKITYDNGPVAFIHPKCKKKKKRMIDGTTTES